MQISKVSQFHTSLRRPMAWVTWVCFCFGLLWIGCSPQTGQTGEDPDGHLQVLPGTPDSSAASEPPIDHVPPETTPREHRDPADGADPDPDPDLDTQNTEPSPPQEIHSENSEDHTTSETDQEYNPEPPWESTSTQESTGEYNNPELQDTHDQGHSGVGQACSVSGVAGVCLYTTDCTGQRRSVPGHCPGPSTLQCCIPDNSGTGSYCAVSIPSSCQPVSAFSATCSCSTTPPTPQHQGKTEKPGQGGCPAGMLKVERFCIDQYEASLVEILPNNTEQAWSPFLNPGTRKMKAVSVEGVVPQGYISGSQAENACKIAGKRLCTDTEWLRACQGAQKYTYPYGNTKQKGWCNEDRTTHPAIEYFGHSRSCVFSYISHPCINQLPASLAKTAAHSQCVTSEGIYDMMGNLHEWTADPAGTFRGGYYVDTYRNGSGCLYRTTAHDKNHWDYSTGFRCCADLPP